MTWLRDIRIATIMAGCLAAGPLLAAVQVSDPQTLAALESAMAAPDSFADAAEAQVWLLDMSTRLERRVPDSEYRMELLRAVHRESKRAQVPAEMVLAVIEIESAFERTAISHAGALGLMQVMPFWRDEIGRPDDDLLNPWVNLRYGTTILAHYRDREKGDWRRALNRYNGKLRNNPYADKVLDALRRRWYKQ